MLRLRALLMTMAVIVGACGTSNVATPSPVATTTIVASSPAASGAVSSPAVPIAPPADGSLQATLDAVVADAVSREGQPLDPVNDHLALLEAMGIRESLGTDADAILALLIDTENEAISRRTLPDAKSAIIGAAFKSPPDLSRTQFGPLMAGAVEIIGYPADNPNVNDLGTKSFTQTDGGRSSTATIHTVVTYSTTGSVGKLEMKTDIDETVTDTATGQTVLTDSNKTRLFGQLDACPNAAGLVPASLDTSIEITASTTGGPGGGGSSATGSSDQSSTFEGTTDDTATLGAITQSYTHHEKFHRSTTTDGDEATSDGEYTVATTGISDGVPATIAEGSGFVGGWTGAKSDVKGSGDVTAAMIGQITGSAGYDFVTMNPAYRHAQDVWRDTRCMIVTAPSYIPMSAFANNAKPTHTEEVDKGSTTQFDVGLDHRYGQTVPPVKIVAELDGKESLDPKTVEKPPGSLTYVAPDQDGKDAYVRLTATSRQGIAKLVLIFHTGAKKLEVGMNGTLTVSALGVSYTTTISIPKVVLELQPDGTYRGSGPVKGTMRINGDVPCPTPFKEQGTVVLTAKRPIAEIARQGQANPVLDETVPRDWKVNYDSASKVLDSGSCLGISLGQFLQLGPDGMTGPFMIALLGGFKPDGSLADLTFKPEGGKKTVKQTVSVGASQDTVNATVDAKVISESKP